MALPSLPFALEVRHTVLESRAVRVFRLSSTVDTPAGHCVVRHLIEYPVGSTLIPNDEAAALLQPLLDNGLLQATDTPPSADVVLDGEIVEVTLHTQDITHHFVWHDLRRGTPLLDALLGLSIFPPRL